MAKFHPILRASSVLQGLLQPLRQLDIDYFALSTVNDEKLYGIASDEKWFSHYLTSNYAKFDMYTNGDSEKIKKNLYIAWDGLEGTEFFKKAYQASVEHGISHVFSISQNISGAFYSFFFGTSVTNKSMNQVYYNNIDVLLNFIVLIKEKLATNKILREAMRLEITQLPSVREPEVMIPTHAYGECVADNVLPCFMPKGFGNAGALSARELQCLYWLGQAKTNQQTAQLMNCSQRMIEEYIVKLKQKLDCKSLFQLGEKVIDLNIQPILQP